MLAEKEMEPKEEDNIEVNSPPPPPPLAPVAKYNSFLNSLLYVYLPVFVFSLIFLTVLFIPTLLSIVVKREMTPKYVSTKINELIKHQIPMIDGHNDLPIYLKESIEYSGVEPDLWKLHYMNGTNPMQTDIPRLRKGELSGQFWSVYLACNSSDYTIPVGSGLNDPRNAAYVQKVLKQIEFVRQMISKYGTVFKLSTSASDISANFALSQTPGVYYLSSLMGIEGGHLLGGDLSMLQVFYDLGVRYMTLTHSCSTNWAKSATDTNGPQEGLTPFGIRVVQEMNKVGMMVDLSHVDWSTMEVALNVSAAPVIFSHSNAYAVCATKRNVPDNILLKLKENGGIIMVNYYPAYVANSERLAWLSLYQTYPNATSQEKNLLMREWEAQNPDKRATIDDLVAHIDHIKNVTGSVDNIGLGSDFDGMGFWMKELDDVSKHRKLLERLFVKGYTLDEIRKIAGANLLRVMRRVEAVASRLNNPSQEPLEP